MNFRAVFIRWLDSEGVNEWTPIEDISDHLDVTYSIGFLVKEAEDHILIALSWDPETKSIHNYKKIPRAAILGKIKTVWTSKMSLR